MNEHHYSATTCADWILHFHFFDRKHVLWFSPMFYTYRMPNPRTSNPLRVYEELFEMWFDRDEHSPKYKDKLLSLVNKINKRQDLGLLEDSMARRLKELFSTLSPDFMFPFIVRVNDKSCPPKTRLLAGSGATAGSKEFLVVDLDDSVCELLFVDGPLPQVLDVLFNRSRAGLIYLDRYQVFDELESALKINER
jgi:hypothetical protein